MSESKGDFLGFTFIINGTLYKSQDLGITRVSDGDRYKDSLVPEIEDKTVEIPGLDGAYFYGSNFKTRTISLSIAFDEVTEQQLRTMRQVFGYRHTGELIFDEMPYKKYLVKVASPPELEYVCFDERKKTASTTPQDGVRVEDREEVVIEDTYEEEITIKPGEIESYSIEGAPESITVTSNGEAVPETLWDYEDGILNVYGVDIEEDMVVTVTYTLSHMEQQIEREKVYPWKYIQDDQGNDVYERIYKGEGSIEFAAYFPFAKSVAKDRDTFETLGYTNIDEWWDASGLLSDDDERRQNLDVYVPDIVGSENENENEGENEGEETISESGTIKVYNPGDVETGFRLYISFDSNNQIPTLNIIYNNTEDPEYEELKLHLDSFTKKDGSQDFGVIVNTGNGLIEGYEEVEFPSGEHTMVTSGNIYNEYATGDFFKIEPGVDVQTITITGIPYDENSEINVTPIIYYDYLYF